MIFYNGRSNVQSLEDQDLIYWLEKDLGSTVHVYNVILLLNQLAWSEWAAYHVKIFKVKLTTAGRNANANVTHAVFYSP